MPDARRNPFRSEADAFRLLMTVVAAGALVVALAVLIRPLVGALVGLMLVAVGLWRAWGWVRHWFGARPERSERGHSEKEQSD